MKIKKLTILIALIPLPFFAQTDTVRWKAQWIGAPWQDETCPMELNPLMPNARVAPEFQYSFAIRKPVTHAMLHTSGLGFADVHIDGHKIGDEVLWPNETSYGHRPNLNHFFIAMDDSAWRNFRVFYLSHDVTSCLSIGEHRLTVLLGNGLYAPSNQRWVGAYGSPRLLCQLNITYTDGTADTFYTSPQWDVRQSHIIDNDLFAGEIYDATFESPWQKAASRKAPDGHLMAQDGPADRILTRLSPVSITPLNNGDYRVDFGDYITGWIRLTGICAHKGDSISIDFPTECNCNGTYLYIASGNKPESYAPRFTWYTFRYAIIHGWHGPLTPHHITAEEVRSDVLQTGHFACSNPLLNQINALWCRTLKDNMHLGVVTDCPHREKGPYTGDGQVACVAAIHNFDMHGLYSKWIRDMADCQDTITGYVPNGAPWHPGCGGGVPWGAAICVMPWEVYCYYGDTAILRNNYAAMCGYVHYLSRWRQPDGSILQQLTHASGEPNYWMNLGEWCPPYALVSEKLVHTYYLWRCAKNTAKAAKVLGDSARQNVFDSIANQTASIFDHLFYHHGCFQDASQGTGSGEGYGTGTGGGKGNGANIFGSALTIEHNGLTHLPSARRKAMAAAILDELQSNQYHLNTGIYGTALLFDVLCDLGMAEEAYRVMTQRTFPSIGYWLEQGAQTFWEQWNGQDSHNHPMFGSALVWLYRRVCGMQIDPDAPAYKHIILRPTPVGDLTWASYSTITPFGLASIRWEKSQSGKLTIHTTIPKGSYATLYLPGAQQPITLIEGTHTVTQ
ncbi:MAG: family 78 glycoside hydrolase catalytic domain [Bacteroidales bacterium]|nr:family 78 glycoside hydrolase catalytic domain [Candidatus Colimorpha onthohippi]